MKRLLAAFLAAVAAAAPFAGMAEQEWYHVQELREATRDGWHQTYKPRGVPYGLTWISMVRTWKLSR
jgi:hypothetical protein